MLLGPLPKASCRRHSKAGYCQFLSVTVHNSESFSSMNTSSRLCINPLPPDPWRMKQPLPLRTLIRSPLTCPLHVQQQWALSLWLRNFQMAQPNEAMHAGQGDRQAALRLQDRMTSGESPGDPQGVTCILVHSRAWSGANLDGHQIHHRPSTHTQTKCYEVLCNQYV